MGNRVQICSIDPIGFKNIHRSYSWDLDFPPCPPDQPYVCKWYEDQTDYKVVLTDYWMEHAEKVPVIRDARIVVNDIMVTEGMTKRGCFIPAGDVPTEQELADAHMRRTDYMEQCIRAADAIYGQDPKNIGEIPTEYKRYAVELKASRPWAYAAPRQQAFDCPACGEPLKFGVAVCKSCGAIIDADKAARFGLVAKAVEKPLRVV